MISRTSSQPTIDRLVSGITGLDEVLGGGIPARSIVVVAGQPGSGKTVMALQVISAAARSGRKCMYLTTLSEPALKLIHYMQMFEFFDAGLLERQIHFGDLGTTLRALGAEAALNELTSLVETHTPEVLVVDSFKAFHDLVPADRRRTLVYDLAVMMTAWGATTLLLGEYTEHEIATLPEFAVADGIFRLGTERTALTSVRQLEVLKLRGSATVPGVHFFDITAAGIDFVPRVSAPPDEVPSNVEFDRVSTGVPGLDGLLRGGWPALSTTVVVGGTGTGKSILGWTFLLEGAKRGEPGILLALEETPNQIRRAAGRFGWDLQALERAGLLTLHYAAPIELSTDRLLDTIRKLVARTGACRLVLDSLTSLSLGAVSERRFREVVYALTKHLGNAGVTALMNLEVSELLGSAQLSGHGMSFAADNVLYLRYIESYGRLERAVAVIKARGIEHSSELCRVTIDGAGLVVGQPLTGLHNVLTGLPVQVRND